MGVILRRMIDTAFQHFANTRNIGDQSCCPAAYFDFGTTQVQTFGAKVPPSHRAIFGGGQSFEQCVDAVVYHSENTRHRVLWGVGIDNRAAKGLSFDILRAACDLVSSRNWGVRGCDYVPCVSAMSPLFDAPPAPEHDVVFFLHAGKSEGFPLPPDVPSMTNFAPDLATAIAHIASGDAVVTNSYHGTYWAMLLGRRTLCLPTGPKFDGFRDAPVTAAPDDWQAALPRARRHPALLEEARARNRAFYDKVMAL